MIAVPQADLDDLRDRLRRTRWPEPATDPSQGVPLGWLQELCAHWADGYDWRATEARLNALDPRTVTVDGLGVHVLQARSPHPEALPLVLTHGWPGSVVEFLDVLEPLTHPPDPADAFHVVLPSLPGYGFSDKPDRPGWGVQRIARAWAALMAGLGYERYGAAGSDWGTSVTASLAQQDPAHLAGVHLFPPLAPDPEAPKQDDDDGGYAHEHRTRPQTVGHGLVDSPAGLAAWVLEKFWAWTDRRGAPLEDVIARDRLLDNLMLYWLPGTGASAARLYWESAADVARWIDGPLTAEDVVDVPAGCTVFPGELQRPSRAAAARRFTDIRHWGEPDRGGHFAALEQPALFAAELRAFFALVR